MIVLPTTMVIDEHSTCCWQSWGHGLRTICTRDSQHKRKSAHGQVGFMESVGNLLPVSFNTCKKSFKFRACEKCI